MKKTFLVLLLGSLMTTTAQAQRDPLLWPFDKTSIWNMPLHDNAVYVPAKVKAPVGWVISAEEDILIMTPNAPATPIYYNGSGWDRSRSPCAIEGNLLGAVPIPATFYLDKPANGTPNNCAGILMADGKTLWQGLPFYRCTGSSYATVNYDNGTYDWDGTLNTLTGSGRHGSHGASAMSAVGGTIRVGELRPGSQIPHALKLVMGAMYLYYNSQDATKGYRWPAYAADSYAASNYKGTVPALEMGALLALPTSVSLASLNLESEPGRIVAKALQTYGGYVVDETGGSDGFSIAFERGPAGNVSQQFEADYGYYPWQQGTSTAWARDIVKIFTNLSVVSNNDATNIGGGPTTDATNRRAPLACDCGAVGTGLKCPTASAAPAVLNASFEENAPTATPPGWTTYSATPAVAYAETYAGSPAGAYHLTHYNGQVGTWSAFTSQVVRDLPEGTYSVRAKARKSGTGFVSAWLEAKNYTAAGGRASANIPTSASYQPLELAGLQVTNGQLEIGFWTDVRSGSDWPYVFMDAVELIRTSTAGTAATIAPATTETSATAAASLMAYPNPNHGDATLGLQTKEAQRVTVYVHNAQGSLVSLFTVPAQAGHTDFHVPTPLAPGTYYLRTLVDGQKQQFTLKVE